jgi:HD-GYP domain-containing protein (c-di-GMP phosphodiesterase class II)
VGAVTLPAEVTDVASALHALVPVAKLVRSTHERFDGGGYPDGLIGEQISLPARIVFACDAYHAMVADRPSAAGVSDAEVRDELRLHAGTQFDPGVVEALEAVLDARQGSAQAPTAGDTRPNRLTAFGAAAKNCCAVS